MFSPRFIRLGLLATLFLSPSVCPVPRPVSGVADGPAYLVPYSERGRALYLLPRSRAERRSDPSPASRTSVVVATFEPLLTRLADRFHMVAPDYPGFGHSDAPTPKDFSYTFDNIAKVMYHFTAALNLTKYTLYMQDYGGPVGFRMALAHPDRVEALIVQNAVAHDEGLGATGRYGVRPGWTVPHTRPRCEPTCFRWTPRGRDTSATTRTPRSTIQISGPTNRVLDQARRSGHPK